MVKFGLGIVYIKQMRFGDSYGIVDNLIKRNESQKKNPKYIYYYIRALCAKKLAKYDQARNDYSFILKICKPTYFELLN